MKISVIIPTRNNSARIIEPIQALLKQTLPVHQYEILVIDNGSTDNTQTILAQLSRGASNLRWLTEPTIGKAEARNRGVRETEGDLIIFLDDDIYVQPDHLERHLAYHLQTQEKIAVLGMVVDVSTIRPAWLQTYLHTRQTLGSPDSLTPFHFVTQAISVSRQTLELGRLDGNEANYFDPAFRMRQDGELGYRLSKSGLQLILAEDIICEHHHPRNLQDIMRRSFEIGYATAQFTRKHPETTATLTNHLPRSPISSIGLLITSVVLLMPALLIRPFWQEPSLKVIGAFLQHQRIRGYQRGLKTLDDRV